MNNYKLIILKYKKFETYFKKVIVYGGNYFSIQTKFEM